MKEDQLEKTVAKKYIVMQGFFKYKGERYVLFFSDYCKQNDVNISDAAWDKNFTRLKNRFSGKNELPEKLLNKIVKIAPQLK
jgi:hypothetical protein